MYIIIFTINVNYLMTYLSIHAIIYVALKGSDYYKGIFGFIKEIFPYLLGKFFINIRIYFYKSIIPLH